MVPLVGAGTENGEDPAPLRCRTLPVLGSGGYERAFSRIS